MVDTLGLMLAVKRITKIRENKKNYNQDQNKTASEKMPAVRISY